MNYLTSDAIRWSRLEHALRNLAVDIDDEIARRIAYALAGEPDPSPTDDRFAHLAARHYRALFPERFNDEVRADLCVDHCDNLSLRDRLERLRAVVS